MERKLAIELTKIIISKILIELYKARLEKITKQLDFKKIGI